MTSRDRVWAALKQQPTDKNGPVFPAIFSVPQEGSMKAWIPRQSKLRIILSINIVRSKTRDFPGFSFSSRIHNYYLVFLVL